MSLVARVTRRAYKTAVIVTASMLLVLVFSVLKPLKTQALSAGAITSLTNTQRESSGLSALSQNSKLNASAYAKAQDMLAKGYWSHTSPDGKTAWTFISSAGYAFSTAGENLAKGYASDEALVAGWMASPVHKANILNASFKEVGVGVASGTLNGEAVTIVVAHYASPLSQGTSTAPSPAKTTAAPKPAAPKPAPAPAPAKPAEAAPEPALKAEAAQQSLQTTASASNAAINSQVNNSFWQSLLSQIKALPRVIGQLVTLFALGSGFSADKVVV